MRAETPGEEGVMLFTVVEPHACMSSRPMIAALVESIAPCSVTTAPLVPSVSARTITHGDVDLF
jgi:hypothetical protein